MLETRRRGGSNEYPQSMFLIKKKKKKKKKKKLGVPLLTPFSPCKSGVYGGVRCIDISALCLIYLQSDPFETFILAGSSGVNQLYSAVVEICNSTGCISYVSSV